jgi:hypothetical protein
MPRFKHPLDHVRVASPCKSDWNQMIGTTQVRFCGQCNLNVYNLSGMTRDQAESLIAANEGRLCVRFYRRRDGSIITQDCPVGLQVVRAEVSYWTKAVVAAVLTFLATIGFHSLLSGFHPSAPRMMMGGLQMPVDKVILKRQPAVGSSNDIVPGQSVDRRPDHAKRRH